MKHSTLRALGLPVVLSALVLGAGCATRADLDDVRKLAQDADADVKKLAQDAKVSADQANRTAAEAKEAAAAAKSAAAAAQRAAEEARMVSQQTGEKIDRAFKKAVQK